MNSFKIANSINMIDDDLILEADETAKSNKAQKKPVYLKYAAAAAALVCAAGGAAAIAKVRNPSTSVDSNNSSVQTIDNAPSNNSHVIKMSNIHFNNTLVSISDSLWNPRMFDQTVLDTAGITEYFGWDLVPKYIPEGLFPSERNDSSRIYSDKDDGRIVHDRTVIQFYDSYDEDGFPKGTVSAEYKAPKGFELTAAKYGSLDLCCRLDISNIANTSSIGGTDVYFAHLSVPIGKVSDPSGYWDEYIAEFELNGIQYRVTTKQLEAGEIVRIVSSIIYGENVSVEE
ncbi:MAG: hypothetical protein K2N56_02860 [Oscillospiraceae bacterium]|nr:hypothetical protein [Oscillospiraceae bacterium]